MDTILVVDDEVNYLTVMEALLGGTGYEVLTAPSAMEALKIAGAADLDLVLTDMKMPKMSGIELLDELHRLYPELPVIIMTAFGTVEKAVTAMKKGAFDYILKPFKNDEILMTIAKALEYRRLMVTNRLLYQELEKKYGFPNIVGESKVMQEILALVKRVATSKATVLVTGESGTGKELIARAIHQSSNRAQKPFISVNCAALTETLLESELFGHERGAFTHAVAMRKGRFELADGGTLFLDEVAEMSQALQVKLLRVLQEMEFERVGGNRTIKVDVRVVAASNRDLKEEVEAGRFREDLFYRLNVVHLHIPPLRQRQEDIPLLAAHFIKKYAHGKRPGQDPPHPGGLEGPGAVRLAGQRPGTGKRHGAGRDPVPQQRHHPRGPARGPGPGRQRGPAGHRPLRAAAHPAARGPGGHRGADDPPGPGKVRPGPGPRRRTPRHHQEPAAIQAEEVSPDDLNW